MLLFLCQSFMFYEVQCPHTLVGGGKCLTFLAPYHIILSAIVVSRHPTFGSHSILGLDTSMDKDSPRLPTEIWQTILRHAMFIPAFLDPDAVAGIPSRMVCSASIEWNNVQKYKESETTRQNLRQVCQSWRSYLQLFEDRYVKMIDIRHEEVPPQALKRAIRVSFWGGHCFCDICDSTYIGPHQETFEEFCWKTLKKQGPLRAEILDMTGAQFDIRRMWKIVDDIPNLVTLSATDCSWRTYMTRFINYVPHLRHCLGRGFWGSSEYESRFHSTTLQTLHMIIQNSPSQSYLSAEYWYLPNLRNLGLGYHRASEQTHDFYDIVYPLLMIIGGNIVWLDISFTKGSPELPPLFWAVCPQVEYFKTSMKLSTPPPEDHPIRTLCVPMIHGHKYDQPPGYSSLFPAWSNLRVLMIGNQSSSSRYLGIYPTWVRKCKQRNIRLVDVHDETLDSYTKRLGIYFDKCGNVCLSSFPVHAP
jgi:hypothetical protein